MELPAFDRHNQLSWHLDHPAEAPSSEGVKEIAALLDPALDANEGQDYAVPLALRELLREVGYDEPLLSGRMRETNDGNQLLLRLRLREVPSAMTMLYLQAFRAPGAGNKFELGPTLLAVDYKQDQRSGSLTPRHGMALRLALR
jgi:hypothetical protein